MKRFSAFVLPILLAISVQAQLSGPLSGVLPGDSTYTVIGDIEVESGDSLVIEAGAVLLFNFYRQFDIRGYLHAAGTENDSIKFIKRGAMEWQGIDFNLFSTPFSRLEYCLISGSSASGISCNASNPIITNCTIIGNTHLFYGGGIQLNNSEPSIENCYIGQNIASFYGGGIYCDNYSDPAIYNCIVEDNEAYSYGGGIFCHSSNPTITDCIISSNISLTNGGGIYCENSSPSITGCIISSSNAFNYGGGIYCINSNLVIEGGTISGNAVQNFQGGGIYCMSSDLYFLNTILEGSIGNYGIYLDNSPGVSINYCNFYNNQNGNFNNPPAGVGIITTVNINGDSCDIYHNIFLNPQFYSTTGDSAFYLTANSPCIDAGAPYIMPDPDGTIADIGAYYFDQSSQPINDLIITISGSDVVLQWAPITAAVSYIIYRSDEPYFDITGMIPISTTTNESFTDTNAVSAEGGWFYKVTYQY